MTIPLRRFSNLGKGPSGIDLEQVDLLKGLDVNTRYKITKSLQRQEYQPGEVIFFKGSTGQSLYFVQRGVVNVVVGPARAHPNHPASEIVDQIHAGSVFGEMALLLSMPRTATICAATTSNNETGTAESKENNEEDAKDNTVVVLELKRADFEAAAERSYVLNERLDAIKEERFKRFRQDLKLAYDNPAGMENMNPKERAYLLEVFKQIDADNSGAIDQDELGCLLTRLSGRFYSKEQVACMMSMLDADGNGTIEANEFINSLPLLAKWLDHSHDAAAQELDLEKVELLKGIDAQTKFRICMALKKRSYTRHEVVFWQKSTGKSLFFLQQGCMDVVVNHTVVDQIQQGSLFGEMALLLDMPRTATIRCASHKALCFELERADFEAAAAASVLLCHRLDIIKEQRFTRFRKDLETAVLRPADIDDLQKAYLVQVFKEIDADDSGAIDQEEMAVLLSRLAGRPFPSEEVTAMMQVMDKDKNQLVEFDEFMAGLPLLAKWLLTTTTTSNNNNQNIGQQFSARKFSTYPTASLVEQSLEQPVAMTSQSKDCVEPSLPVAPECRQLPSLVDFALDNLVEAMERTNMGFSAEDLITELVARLNLRDQDQTCERCKRSGWH